MKRAILLYNNQAGRGKIGRNLDRVLAIFREADYDIVPIPIRFDSSELDDYEGLELVVVAGGDGTLNYVVNVMMRRGLNIPLGILPAGTANDFAGALGMSNNILKATAQIAYGTAEMIDCGMVEPMGRTDVKPIYFVNIFSFGIFTTTSQHTPEELKHLMGRAAYMVEAIKELKRVRAIPLTITADGDAFYYPTLMGLVLNGETAGRVPLVRRSNLCDGVFDCLFLRKRNTVFESACDMFLYVIGVRTKAVKYLQAKELMLVTPVSELTDVDGQSGGHFPMRVRCLHRALNIVCPYEARC